MSLGCVLYLQWVFHVDVPETREEAVALQLSRQFDLFSFCWTSWFLSTVSVLAEISSVERCQHLKKKKERKENQNSCDDWFRLEYLMLLLFIYFVLSIAECIVQEDDMTVAMSFYYSKYVHVHTCVILLAWFHVLFYPKCLLLEWELM